MKINKPAQALAGGAIALFLLIQLIPFGHTRSNPPIVSEPNWSSPQARALVKEHCFQCHSNETNWTWYPRIAPVSWVFAYGVIEGRKDFNFSNWEKNPADLGEIVEVIQAKDMPPLQLWIFHRNFRLDVRQKEELIEAILSSAQ